MKRNFVILLSRYSINLCLFCIFTWETFAQSPSINSVSGSIANNAVVTISGSAFGSGPDLLTYDNFESGTAGSTLKTGSGSATIGVWNTLNGTLLPAYSNITSVSGNNSCRMDASQGNSTATANLPANTSDFFISWWMFIPSGDRWPGEDHPERDNWKIFWIIGPPNSTSGGFAYNDKIIPGKLGSVGNLLTGNDCPYNFWVSLGMQKGKWCRVWAWVKGRTDNTGQIQYYELTGSGVATRVDKSNLQTCVTGKPYHDRVFMNGYVRTTANCHPTFDDVYIATGSNARARIEIGNNPNYYNCTNLSICTPVSWNNASITATIRQGSLSNGTAYLFIIDANGNVSSGYPISIGGGTVTQYTITASASSGGTITPNGNVQVVRGNNQSFAITPNPGYTISQVTVDGANQGAVSTYTFPNVQAAHTISATFSAIPIDNELTIDNSDAGTSNSGSWSSSTYWPGFYGSNYLYAPDAAGHWYQWTTSLSAGTYEVYAWWTATAGRPTDVAYDITYASGTANVTKNQETDGGIWNLLGTYTFGTTATVRLNSSATGTEGACADAIRLVKVQQSHSFSFEAEDAKLKNYTIETNNFASQGKMVKTDATGTAEFTFSGSNNKYNLKIYYFDENDGKSTYKVTVDGKATGSWTANLQLGSASPDKFSLTSRTISGVTLANDSKIVVQGVRNKGEFARIDRILIEPASENNARSENQFLTDLDKVSEQARNISESDFQIFPNPATTSVTISNITDNTSKAFVSVYSVLGEKVFEAGDKVNLPYSMDMESYQSGTYIFKICIDNVMFTKKVTKM